MSENKVSAIVDLLRADILDGKYAPGAAFPSVKMLCSRFGVAHLTAVRVIESLKQLGLVKSRNGVGTFVARRMTTVGLVIPMMSHVEIFPPICNEFSRLCMEKGISMEFADMSSLRHDMVGDIVVATARRMVDKKVSGVVFHPVDFADTASEINCQTLRLFSAANIPVVILDSDVEAVPGESRFDFVGVDNFEIGRFAGQHVIERGARKIAFVTWSVMNDNVRRRLDGLASAIAQKRGVKLTGRYVWQSDEALMSRRFKSSLPDAIVCSSDLVAAHVLNLLRKIGKKCPQDVLVTGVNDVDIATLVSPTLTTVHQPCKDIARAAFETLLWRFDNPDAEKRRIMLAAPLVVRESTTR